jgi:hypothetical protein
MKHNVERYHWLNTIAGLLDAAFYLSEEEQFLVIDIVNRLLVNLRIPERGDVAEMPPALALEVKAGFYTTTLSGPRESGVERPVRATGHGDVVVSVESWRQAFLDMLVTAYPSIEPFERMAVSKVLTDVLVALGVPERKAAFYPDAVVRAYQEGPDAPWRQ